MDEQEGTILCILLCAIVFVSSLFGGIVVGAIAFCSLCFVYFTIKKGFIDSRRIDADTLSLLRNMKANYSRGASARVVLSKSIRSGFVFGKALSLAVNAYFRSGDLNFSFRGLERYRSAVFGEAVSMIKDYIGNGAGIRKRLDDMLAAAERLEGQRLRSHGGLTNAFSVVRLGSILFFPMFAGISCRIIAFSAAMGLSGSIAAQSLLPVILFYVVASNAIGSLSFYRGTELRAVVSNASLCAGGALLVFSAASAAASLMLR
jgi:hypothetical protein